MESAVIRPASTGDGRQLSSLLAENKYHRHLDWRNPIDLLGKQPFLVMEREAHITAALACPLDPPGVAWLRLFATGFGESRIRAWHELWNSARQQLPARVTMAAISLHQWLDDLLVASGFQRTQELVMLEKKTDAFSLPSMENHVGIRPMLGTDLEVVGNVDWAAFPPLWRISLEDLHLAFAQASYASVYEDEGKLLGYQVSTRSSIGLHLARLAVHPAAQGKGVGRYLVRDLCWQASQQDIHHFTVNTQDDNNASLSLYAKLGFKLTGERYPVYTLSLAG